MVTNALLLFRVIDTGVVVVAPPWAGNAAVDVPNDVFEVGIGELGAGVVGW